MKALIVALACALWAGQASAQAADTAVEPLPSLVRDAAHPVAWPRAIDGSTWVPVFMLGDSDDNPLTGPFSPDSTGVLLGIAQVRGQSIGGQDTVSVSPSLRWQLNEDLRFGAAMTVTEFVPCRSLMHSPLAPVQTDACESFAAQNSPNVGVSGALSLGNASFSLGYSESPAIWVLPGAIGPTSPAGGQSSAALPLAPLASIANESAQTLTLGGELSLSAQSRLGLALAMSRMPRLENSPDIGRVQFSLAYGDFSAEMATQMIRQGIETVSPLWAGVDLGVSWRTPWSGIISVGARNLFTNGDPPQLGNSPVASPSEADAFSRTPYVRYEQDF